MARLHPQAQKYFDLIAASQERPMEQMSAQEARAIADERVMRTTFARRDGVRVNDRSIAGPGGEIPLRIYAPERAATRRAVLTYFHGGGMVVGSIATVDPHCRHLALELDCIVVSVGYRLAPEHKFPAGAEDAIAAAKWIQDHAEDFGGDPARLAMVGESSGGTLTAVVCHALRDAGRPAPRVQVMIYPVLDCSTEWDSFRRYESGYFLTKQKWLWFCAQYQREPQDLLDPLASPLRAQRFDHLPPALIITAEYDPLVDSAKAYADKLLASGVAVNYTFLTGWPHGFFYWADTDAAQTTMALCIDSIRKACA